MKLDSVEKVLEYAIAKEEDAYRFYIDLAGRTNRPHMRALFEGFAKEEQGHKQKLIGVREGQIAMPSPEKVRDLKIGDNLVEVELNADMELQDALIVAMKAEKAAFKLYTDLAEAAGDTVTRDLFQSLAQEEARHKLRFEIEYDNYVYKEN